MELLKTILSILVGLILLNVWILRINKATSWRGGEARNMREEFAAYGLPYWFMIVVGSLKVTIGIALIASVWFPFLAQSAAAVLSVLMLGAVTMHLKVGDPLKKAVPSFTLLCVSIFLAATG